MAKSVASTLCFARFAIFFVLLAGVINPASTLAGHIKVEPGTTIRVGEEVFFDGSKVTIPGGALLANGMVNGCYYWDFGDYFMQPAMDPNSKKHGTVAVHRYMRPGSYTVALTVTDIYGKTTTDSTTITVQGTYPKLPPRSFNTPVLYLKFDNDINDSSGNGLNGSWVGGTGSYVQGMEGNAVSLNGAYIQIADSNLLEGMSQFTVAFWSRNKSSTNTGYIFIKQNCYLFNFDTGGSGDVRAALYTTIGYTICDNTIPYVRNKSWHHYAITYDGAVSELFIDGVKSPVGTSHPSFTGSIAANTNNLYIGARYDGTLKFNGVIDELKLYNKALTADEIVVGFEAWRADFHSRSKQYITVRIPTDITTVSTNKLKVMLNGNTIHTKNSALLNEEIFLFDQTALTAGDYTITYQLLNSSDEVIEQFSEYWTKGCNGIPKVAINENGAILFDGELFFPITPHAIPKDTFDDWTVTNDAINCLFSSGVYGAWNITPATWIDYVETGAAHGVKAIGPGPASYAIGGPKGQLNNPDRMIEFIDATKDEPTMVMWQFGDEPELGTAEKACHPAVVAGHKYLCHKNDPNHPYTINVAGTGWKGTVPFYTDRKFYYNYVNNAALFGGSRGIFNKGVPVCDAIGFDYWAIIKWCSAEGSDRVYMLANVLDDLNRGFYNRLPIFAYVPMGEWWPAENKCGTMQPSDDQIRMFAWLCIIHGAKGLHWAQFWHNWQSKFSVVGQLKDQITSLKDVILQPAPTRTVTDNANVSGNLVDTMIREYGGEVYIFAARVTEVNEPQSGDDKTVTFTVGNINDTTASVVDEGRTLNVVNGTFQDTFAPNGVHIYRIPLSGQTSNHAPVLQEIGNKSVNESALLTFTVSATDPNGDVVTYLASGLPAGATFSSQTFTWTPTYSQAGTYQVTFIASDGYAQDSETVTITVNNVNRAPVLEAIGDRSVNENSLLTISVSASDPDGNAITYSVGGLPSGAVFANRTFTWTPGYNQADNYQVTFIAGDGQSQDSETITITVSNVNRAPVLGAIGNKSVYADDPLNFTVSASDPDGDAVEFSVSGMPSGATFAGQSFNWQPDSTQAGSYQVSFAASDGELQDSETITINVLSADTLPPVVTNCSPAADSIQVPLNRLVVLHITDAGKGVDANSVIIKVDGNIIYSSNTLAYSSGYGNCRRSGTKADYTFVYQSNEMFDFDQTVAITVNAADLAGNVMSQQSYSFTTEMRSFGQNKKVSPGSDTSSKAAPATVQDSAGNIWTAWHAGSAGSRDIYVGKLAAGADNFGSSVRLTESTADQCNPAVAIDSVDKLYVVWQDNRIGTWDIYVTSFDGATWSTEQRVTDTNDNQINPAIAVDNLNRAHIVWQDDRNGNQDIYIATSSNGFITETVSRITSNSADQIEPAIAVDSSNTVYVVWTDARNGSSDIYGAASNNGPWTNVPIVNNAGNQSSPAIAAESEGSILHLLWVDDRSGNQDIYYATSNGLPSSPLSGSSIIDDTTGANQLAPVIITSGSSKVFACWQDRRNVTANGGDTDLYFAELTSDSRTNILVGDDGTNSNQSEPAMGTGEYGHPYLVWTDGRSANTEIYYAGSTFVEPVALKAKDVSASSGATVGTTPATGVDDVSIVVPAGACLYDIKITISKIKNPEAFATQCLGSYDFGPSGIELSLPVTVTIPYTVSSSGTSASAYWYNSLTGALSQQGITDVESLQISSTLYALRFKTTHFTPFYLLLGASAAAASGGGGGGGGGGCSISSGGEGNIVEFLLPYLGLTVVMVILKLRDRRNQKARNIAESIHPS